MAQEMSDLDRFRAYAWLEYDLAMRTINVKQFRERAAALGVDSEEIEEHIAERDRQNEHGPRE